MLASGRPTLIRLGVVALIILIVGSIHKLRSEILDISSIFPAGERWMQHHDRVDTSQISPGATTEAVTGNQSNESIDPTIPNTDTPQEPAASVDDAPEQTELSKTVILGRMPSDDTTWVQQKLNG